MALNTVELIPSATSYSPFSLGRVKLCSRPDPNILQDNAHQLFIKTLTWSEWFYWSNNEHKLKEVTEVYPTCRAWCWVGQWRWMGQPQNVCCLQSEWLSRQSSNCEGPPWRFRTRRSCRSCGFYHEGRHRTGWKCMLSEAWDSWSAMSSQNPVHGLSKQHGS